jgi:5-(carboxyamino)imidazole ribonucleotide mutase
VTVEAQSSPPPDALPVVGIIMGSQSDWATMRHAADILERLGVPHERRIISAHRMVAALTILPVLGVPVESKALSGLDSLLSIVQMPGGVPVGTLAIGPAGAKNAGLLAAAIVALGNSAVASRLALLRNEQTDAVADSPDDAAP